LILEIKVKALFTLIILFISVSGRAQPVLTDKSPSTILDFGEVKQSNLFARYLTVEIGDSTKKDFTPVIRIDAWLGECVAEISLENDDYPLAAATREVSMLNADSKVTIGTPIIEHEAFRREDGNFEWNMLLHSKPLSNIFEYNINLEGLVLSYQPPLPIDDTLEYEIYDGDTSIHHRPLHVVGSYVAWHSTQAGNYKYPIEGDTILYQFQTGVAWRMYRPQAWDSKGDTVWCALNIDTAIGILSITVPQKFLDGAAYPIVIDPTIGVTSVGGSNLVTSFYRCSRWLHSAGVGCMDSAGFWYGEDGATNQITVTMYQNDADLECCHSGTAPTTIAWSTEQHDGVPLGGSGDCELAATDTLWMCIMAGGSITIYYDTDSRLYGSHFTGNGVNCPDPCGGFSWQTATNRTISVYMIYDTGSCGGGPDVWYRRARMLR
jgi:hypothetical protein